MNIVMRVSSGSWQICPAICWIYLGNLSMHLKNNLIAGQIRQQMTNVYFTSYHELQVNTLLYLVCFSVI
jgi:hypothetical protein